MKSIAVFLLICFKANVCIGNLEEKEDDRSGQPTSPSKHEASITFTSNWDEILHGSLIPGGKVRIIFDGARLPGRDKRYGQKAWEICAEVKYHENGTVYSTRLEGPDEIGMMTTTLSIPSDATNFTIWFKHWGYYSGISWDSNHSKNYKFSFSQIVFTGTWDEYVKGGLYAGGRFQVLYNSIRLPWRDVGYLGMGRAWNIFAHARFSDNGTVVQQMLKGPGADDPTMTTVFDIPNDADKVIMWFYFSGYRSGTHYDSNHNKNYLFALSKN